MLAQLVERNDGIVEVSGSIPLRSINIAIYNARPLVFFFIPYTIDLKYLAFALLIKMDAFS